MDSGRGKEEEWGTDGRVKRCWRGGQHRRGGIEIRSQKEGRTWTKLSVGLKEKQLEVKVDA